VGRYIKWNFTYVLLRCFLDILSRLL
jgi:hypothetical protein